MDKYKHYIDSINAAFKKKDFCAFLDAVYALYNAVN